MIHVSFLLGKSPVKWRYAFLIYADGLQRMTKVGARVGLDQDFSVSEDE